jgi:D-glycero-D-manno-heptose 1,7-bisphosphate phosphatase
MPIPRPKQKAKLKSRALFLDRDGVMNEPVWRDGQMHSPRNWSELRHYGGLEKLEEARQLGFLLILVTNQPDVERGIVDMSFLNELHEEYREKYSLSAVYCCPFASNDHHMKKPNPGMFLEAAKKFEIDLERSYHLGDTDRDTMAAKRCGCRSLLWDRPYNQGIECDHRIRSMDDVIPILRAAK